MSEQERRVYEIRRLYLPRLLKWDDRNFMAFGVEGRYPFLDHEVIELALSLAPETLYSRGWIKEPLRRGLAGMLPQSILRRRTKSGFETPQADWLRGPLRPLLGELGARPMRRYGTTCVEKTQWPNLYQRVCRRGDRRSRSSRALMRMLFADRWLRVFFGTLSLRDSQEFRRSSSEFSNSAGAMNACRDDYAESANPG